LALNAIITKIELIGNSIVFKNATNEIIKSIPCYNNHIHPNTCDEVSIYFNHTPSNRDRLIDTIVFDYRNITVPIGTWTRNSLINELTNNFINCTQKVDANVSIIQDPNEPPPGTGTFVDAGNVFSYAGEITAGSSSQDNPLFLIKNPTLSTKKIFLSYVYGGLVAPSNYVVIKMFSQNVISANGTTETAVNNSVGNVNISSMEIYTLPTITTLGNQLRNLIQGGSQNAIKFVEENTIQLLPDENIVITEQPQNNNKDVSLTIIWTEIDV